jgi:3-oxoacyl-[acyl-carrier protein] reductase
MKPVALITGGTRGIGLGIAKTLAGAGIDLALNGVREEPEVAVILDGLRGIGAKVVYCQGNIAVAKEREAVLGAVKSGFGRLDFLVNNAGIAPKHRVDLLDATEESFDHVLGINLKGAYFLSQACAKWMVEQKEAVHGRFPAIINIGSISATMASVNRGEYCVAKAGIAMMTQLFAARLGEAGIPVYEIRPGITKSDMTASPNVTAKYNKLIAEGLTINPRWGTPEDIGKAVLSLCRGDFPYSTGNVFMVDGGMSVPRL